MWADKIGLRIVKAGLQDIKKQLRFFRLMEYHNVEQMKNLPPSKTDSGLGVERKLDIL